MARAMDVINAASWTMCRKTSSSRSSSVSTTASFHDTEDDAASMTHALPFTVKNTFIDTIICSEEDEDLKLRAARRHRTWAPPRLTSDDESEEEYTTVMAPLRQSEPQAEVVELDHSSTSRSSSAASTASLPSLCDTADGAAHAAQAPTFTVKNTFIDDIFHSEEDEDLKLRAARRHRTWAPLRLASDDECEEEYITVLAPLQQPEPQPEVQEVDPLASRQPQESLGSASHASGLCRPCAWFWQAQGCQNGAECRHCHLCPVGEVKNKRKANKKLAKALKAAMKAQEDSESASQSD